MRPIYAILTVLMLTGIVHAQSVDERIDALERNVNAVLAMQARVQSDIADLKEDVRQIKQGQDALVKALKGKLTSTPTWDGANVAFQDGANAGWSNAASATYSGASMTRTPRTPVRAIFRRAAGGCASGG